MHTFLEMLMTITYLLVTASSVLGGEVNPDQGNEVQGILGEKLTLSWQILLTGIENRFQVDVCLTPDFGSCIAQGTQVSFTVTSATNYTNRLTASINAETSRHVLTIENLNQSDNAVIFYIGVSFNQGIDQVDTKQSTVQIKVLAKPASSDDGGTDAGLIAGVVIGVILFIAIVIAVIFIKIRWKKNRPSKTSGSESMSALRHSDPYDDKNHYASTVEAVPQEKRQQQTYAPLGPGGGRIGPKDEPIRSNYAEVKTDDLGYPATGPTSGPAKPVRGQSRQADLEEDDNGFNAGVIV